MFTITVYYSTSAPPFEMQSRYRSTAVNLADNQFCFWNVRQVIVTDETGHLIYNVY